ncbi:PadR family transcriptional regulator [Aphanothece hegewaldii CCALA 016]|uniref:PadR family transcriptional regulator n=1 Tax=Aphanothece hegewaldii CCALA 016 TaxID=2107694 RepID=A0A2T1LRY5_9CHRO|nr:PadR family transcriptional regulator [Aphanothece hegewaldii]PSF31992.1 PadR family transcriptional regulator [Aphanothece hegewaldii CCALA 016]
MFRYTYFYAPAWAGADFGPQFERNQSFSQCRGSKRGWGDQPRMQRGEIKFILLELLSENPKHGYELIKELESRFCRVSPGSVYPTLQMLEDGGYLTSEAVDDKRVYTITESGRQLLNERQRPQKESMRGQPSPELMELRTSVTELNDAIAIVARSGTPEQTLQVRDLLTQLKREIYKMLSE